MLICARSTDTFIWSTGRSIHVGPWLALEALDDLIGGLAHGGPVPDSDDLVVRAEPSAVGRTRVDRTGDGEEPVVGVVLHIGTDAPVLRLEVLLELLVGLGGEVGGVAVEALQHALHGRLQEGLAVHGIALEVQLLNHCDEALDPGEVVGHLTAESPAAFLAAHASKPGLVEAVLPQLLQVGASEPAGLAGEL
ncbi:MAG: hypothetical protein ACPGPE_11600 [Planctomycetota bacterium]